MSTLPADPIPEPGQPVGVALEPKSKGIIPVPAWMDHLDGMIDSGWDRLRSTFLVDPEGVIRQSWQPVKVPGHAQAVLDALKAANRK